MLSMANDYGPFAEGANPVPPIGIVKLPELPLHPLHPLNDQSPSNQSQGSVNWVLRMSRSGQECMRRWEYSALLQKRKLAWDEAEEKSYRTGNPFTHRDGEMVKRPPTDMIGVVLKRYCEEAGVQHYQ